MVISTGAEKYMTTAKREQIIASLRDAEYRREFAADVGTGIAFQIRLLREDRGWSQGELAQRTGTGKRQETISQWENPNYGRYSLATLIELAAAFDVAPIFRFAPFSDLIDWTTNLSPDRLAPPSFEAQFGSNAMLVASPGGVATDSDGYLSALTTIQVDDNLSSLTTTQADEGEFEFAISKSSIRENQYVKAA